METSPLKYFDVLKARQAYVAGHNVTELLRAQQGVLANTSEIIEIAYDLQAGTYIEAAMANDSFTTRYARELAGILSPHIGPTDTLLDVGTGEITTLSQVTRGLASLPLHTFAFDISWSRIRLGLGYANAHMAQGLDRFTAFVADISEIPLIDKAVNVTISSHALEPNGGRIRQLLSEIFRVTRDKVILFEPCYEINSEEGRRRMDRLGYIKGIEATVQALGGKLVDQITIQTVSNPLNPTVGFVIEPPSAQAGPSAGSDPLDIFSVPGSSHALTRRDGFYFSNTTGLCFPILDGIPVLKSNSAILATALSTEEPCHV